MNGSKIGYQYLPGGTYPPGCIMPIPTRWQVKQNWMWGSMTIKDEWGADIFQAEAKLFTIGHQLHFIDNRVGAEVAYVKQQIRLGMPKYSIFVGGHEYGQIKRKLTFLQPEFTIERIDGEPVLVTGDWAAHSYTFQGRDGNIIATVEKKWLTMRDTYTVEIQPQQNVIFILVCCIVIDKCTTKN